MGRFWLCLAGFCFLFLGVIITVNAQNKAPLTVVATSKTTLLRGYTRAVETRRIAAEFGGRILQLPYDVGQTIGNQPMVVLDATFVDLSIEKAQQQVQKLALSQQRLKSRINFLDKQYQRFEALHQGHRATEVKRDSALEELVQARLERQVIEVETTVARTRLKELDEQRKRHRVFGPKGWRVVSKQVEAGEIVSPGHPLIRVADFRTLVVPFSLSRAELTALKKLGKSFEISVQETKSTAAIQWCNPEFNPQTRKTDVELILREYKGELRGGLVCQLELALPAENMSIPKAAVIDRYENPKVVLADSKKSVNIIVLGETEQHFIIAPNKTLKPGLLLQPKP